MANLQSLYSMFTKGTGILSHIDSISRHIPNILGMSNGSDKSSSSDEKLKAHHSGKGQIDERLFMSACARATTRLVREHATDVNNARKWIADIVNIINSYDAPRRRNIILTIGLEQTSAIRPIPDSKKKKKSKKNKEATMAPTEIETLLQNVDGQDIIIMMALYHNDTFTRACCKAMSTDNDIFDHYYNKVTDFLVKADTLCAEGLQDVGDIAKEILKNPVDGNGNEVPVFRAPEWTNFMLFNRKKKIAELEKEYYKKKGVTKW